MAPMVAVVLVMAVLLTACDAGARGADSPDSSPAGRSSPGAAPAAPPPFPHVAEVTLACRYVALEVGVRVTREGEGEVCRPGAPRTVGDVQVLQVLEVRALLTIRSPDRSDYLVEWPDTNVKAGDPWPLPSR